MNKLAFALPCILLLSGCLRLEFPNLASDTVKAGKEMMSSSGKGIVFSNTVVAEPNEASEALAGQCLKELEVQARDKLRQDQLAYKVISKEVSKRGGKLVATCSLEIL